MLSLSKSKISIPIGSVIPWIKENRVINSNTYGYNVNGSTSTNRVGFSFTGQDLIDMGISEGSIFEFQTYIRKVIDDQWVNNAVVTLYANPSTTVANAIVSGTSLGSVETSSTSYVLSSRVTTSSFAWTSSTDFVVAWFEQDYNSSREGHTQFKDFSLFMKDSKLTSNFKECDGSIISDSESPLNGQTLPDLNGDKRFLRGHSTTSLTGGTETHRHSFYFSMYDTSSSSGGVTSDPKYPEYSTTYYTDYASNIPVYNSVIWIMRIK